MGVPLGPAVVVAPRRVVRAPQRPHAEVLRRGRAKRRVRERMDDASARLDFERAPSMLHALKKHWRRFAFITTEKCSYGSTSSLPSPQVRMSALPQRTNCFPRSAVTDALRRVARASRSENSGR